MEKEKPYLPFEQDGKTYNLYEMPDGFVVNGDLDLSGQEDLEELPDLSKVIVKGNFYCSNCHNLRTLKGSPKEVGRSFVCFCCENLTSLEGAPEQVGKEFYCFNCEHLTSLEGAPKEVGENFICSNCDNLTSLEGAPEKVGGSFYCNRCDSLTCLEGAPKEVGENFVCNNCDNLTSLEGSPEKVYGDFDCASCNNLTSLDGAPKKVVGNFICDDKLREKYFESKGLSGIKELRSSPRYQVELMEYEVQQKQKEKNALNIKRLRFKLMKTIAAENVSDEIDGKTGKRKINPKRSKEEKKAITDMLTSMAKDITD